VRAGMDVLDVGSGTGLLALEAALRVGASGSVVALDVSAAALRELTQSGRNIRLLLGDAVSLPLADECVDAVVTRSVLIYVIDKTRSAVEFRRVLRPGGRVSMFEPINRRYQFFADVDLADLEPQRGRVLERWLGQRDLGGAMMGFDERDLERAFVDAGFDSVDLTYEVVRRRTRPTRRDVWRSLTTRPNPNMVSYEEAAREELGEAADDHLADLATALTTRSSTSTSADAYLSAQRSRR
jgi:arsenite methyltransferase